MKIISKVICSITVFGLLACGDSAPKAGTGPGFPSGMTAKELFTLVTVNLYVPDPLSGDETFNDGTANCVDGGKASVEDTKFGNSENSTITFTSCESKYGADNIALKQNGTIYYYLTANDINNPTHATFFFRHQLSYSGDIGFAADCEFTVESDETAGGGIQKVNGSCTYIDSEGNELSLDGDAMLEAIQAL